MVIELRVFIEKSPSAIKLVNDIEQSLSKTPYKFFGFLPGVNDIRRTIEKLFQKPEYKLKQLLREECTIMRGENSELKDKVNSLQTSVDQGRYKSLDEWKALERDRDDLEIKVNALEAKNRAVAMLAIALGHSAPKRRSSNATSLPAAPALVSFF